MGDSVELQVTPETPGRPSIRNPFESPNDYHHLHEPLVPSPSIFKSKISKSTPAKFNWSIDELASLLPVHIDPEDIQRQSFYLSQNTADSEIEEKRQNAVEQFFTKGVIVPSPWSAPSTKNVTQKNNYKSSMSPAILEEPLSPKKYNVACQTALSLPMDFDLEKILGEYYRDEACDSLQESLSSSSLRRKLFLDGQGSGNSSSDTSNPPSPERAQPWEQRHQGARGRCVSPVLSSPLSCGVKAHTPSTGQFSSSPIQQGGVRDYSLGSVASPLLHQRSSPAAFGSPTLSPIGPLIVTPIASGERKQLNFVSPDSAPHSSDMDANPCAESPYVEGCSPIHSCSPIRSCSPHRLQSHGQRQARSRPRVRCWASPPIISPILSSELQQMQEHHDWLSSTSVQQNMEMEPLPRLTHNNLPGEPESRLGSDALSEGVTMEEDDAAMEGSLEHSDEEKESEAGVQLTSSCVGSASATEGSQMFVSLLTEGSGVRQDSSMQVDSGYNTTLAGTASLIDGISPHCHGKESFSSNPKEQAYLFSRPTQVKSLNP